MENLFWITLVYPATTQMTRTIGSPSIRYQPDLLIGSISNWRRSEGFCEDLILSILQQLLRKFPGCQILPPTQWRLLPLRVSPTAHVKTVYIRTISDILLYHRFSKTTFIPWPQCDKSLPSRQHMQHIVAKCTLRRSCQHHFFVAIFLMRVLNHRIEFSQVRMCILNGVNAV